MNKSLVYVVLSVILICGSTITIIVTFLEREILIAQLSLIWYLLYLLIGVLLLIKYFKTKNNLDDSKAKDRLLELLQKGILNQNEYEISIGRMKQNETNYNNTSEINDSLSLLNEGIIDKETFESIKSRHTNKQTSMPNQTNDSLIVIGLIASLVLIYIFFSVGLGWR